MYPYQIYTSNRQYGSHFFQMAKLALQAWWEQMAWKRRAIQLDTLMAIRRRRTLMLVSLHNWMHATFDGLLVANSKFQDELMESQVHVLQSHPKLV